MLTLTSENSSSKDFIDHFSSFWEELCFWVESNQFFFDLFWFLILLLYEIHQLFLWLFEYFISLIKIGLEFGLKEIIRRWIFINEIKDNHQNIIASATMNISAITLFEDNFKQLSMNNRTEAEKIEPEPTF